MLLRDIHMHMLFASVRYLFVELIPGGRMLTNWPLVKLGLYLELTVTLVTLLQTDHFGIQWFGPTPFILFSPPQKDRRKRIQIHQNKISALPL